MSQTGTEILEIFHFAIHKTLFSVQNRANGEISQNANFNTTICYKGRFK